MKKINREEFFDLPNGDIYLLDDDLSESMIRLWKTANWATRNGASYKEISDLSYAFINNLNWKYSKTTQEVFCKEGGIVIVDYGQNLPGETSGHVQAIVAKYSSIYNAVFAIPITKAKPFIISESYMRINKSEITRKNGWESVDSVAILGMGRLVNPMRVNCVVGKVSQKTMKQIAKKLESIFSTNNHVSKEIILKRYFFEELQKSNCMEDFIEYIDLPNDVAQAFSVLPKVKKITYKDIIAALNQDSEYEKKIKKQFKAWIEKRKDISDKRISVTDLMKMIKNTLNN